MFQSLDMNVTKHEPTILVQTKTQVKYKEQK